MNKDTIIDVLGLIAIISVIGYLCYGSYCYMKRVDTMVEQYRIELLNK